jgi:hypothetical protein
MTAPRIIPPEELAQVAANGWLLREVEVICLGEHAVALVEQRQAVLALHWRDEAPAMVGGMRGLCSHCSALRHDYVDWPCETAVALGVES